VPIKPSESKTVQARILAYAQEIGWTYVPRGEAERRRGFDHSTPISAEPKSPLFDPRILSVFRGAEGGTLSPSCQVGSRDRRRLFAADDAVRVAFPGRSRRHRLADHAPSHAGPRSEGTPSCLPDPKVAPGESRS